MNKGRNQYAVYRLRNSPDYLRSLRHQPYTAWREQNRKVTSDLYAQVCIAVLDPSLNPADLRRQLENGLPAGTAGDPQSGIVIPESNLNAVHRTVFVNDRNYYRNKQQHI